VLKNLPTLLLTLLVLGGCSQEKPPTIELSYSEFIELVERGKVSKVIFSSDNYTLKGETVNGENFETVRPPFLEDNLSEILTIHKVPVSSESVAETSASGLEVLGFSIATLIGLMFLWLIPLVLTVIVVFFVWRFLKKKVKD